ncbi:hypothetical protein BB559_004322 [Furculomyces boomerangus]|uniref:UspA domain-containing protein n=2 Tax=Harpellales TaxID=61421 RepID=A0A2T9Y4T6_9FUNG|nr:hypothetical protein BB559_006083 [Furculomyces boomerangus]PVU91060.1 hypothetical protein BB559_004322 [Furculomyces boomerangus]PVZ99481.1 hypothetical protein BB558_004459 [Smittium angustum]
MESQHQDLTILDNRSTAEEFFLPHGHGKRVIAISVNDTQNSDDVVKWALENIIDKDSDLVVLINVRVINRTADFAAIGGYAEDPLSIEREKEYSHNIVKKYGVKMRQDGYNVKAYSLVGDAGPEIVKKTIELNADHLVIGTRGLSGLKKVFLGSVSEYCSKHCKCAITIVKTQ